MPIKKLTPVKIEANSQLAAQTMAQSLSKVAPKSKDPVNYPVFEVPVNSKVLVYVPNHVVTNADGVEELRMDKPLIHSVKDGSRFAYYRCINGLNSAEYGYDGTCPLCEGVSEPWEYAKEFIASMCKSNNLNPEDKDNDTVKKIRSNAFQDRVLKEATRYFTFPIVVIDTVGNDCKTIMRGPDNNVQFKIMWYTITETQYNDKWKKSLDSLEDEPTHPGGHFFVLNYSYTPKSGEPNKRDSARNLVVSVKSAKSMDGLRKQFDALTEDWTPEKAMEMVLNNNFYSKEDLQYVTDTVLENTRNQLALLRSANAIAESNASSAPAFAIGEKVTTNPAPVQEMDDTDLDID